MKIKLINPNVFVLLLHLDPYGLKPRKLYYRLEEDPSDPEVITVTERSTGRATVIRLPLSDRVDYRGIAADVLGYFAGLRALDQALERKAKNLLTGG